MDKSELCKCITCIQKGVNVKDNYETLWVNYKPFVWFIAGRLSITDYDDYEQNAFIAMQDAVLHYDVERGTSFHWWFSLYIKHYNFRQFLRMNFPFRIPESFYKDNKEVFRDYCSLKLEECSELTEFIEDSSLEFELWKVVFELIPEIGYYILRERFVAERTLENIGIELNVSHSCVKKRISAYFKILRGDVRIRSFARMYYGIKTEE